MLMFLIYCTQIYHRNHDDDRALNYTDNSIRGKLLARTT